MLSRTEPRAPGRGSSARGPAAAPGRSPEMAGPAVPAQGAAPGAARSGAGRGRGSPVPAGSLSPACWAPPSVLLPAFPTQQHRCAAPADRPGRDVSGARRGSGLARRGEARLDGRGRGRGRPALAAGGGGGPARRGAVGARRMAAAGGIATLPDDGGSGAFPPGHFKDPKRLYCKNGGFFLRINPDGKVDGVREKSDPHIKLQLQAEERGVVSIKGVSANRFLAMKEDGRLLALKYATEECFFFERLESNNYNTYRSRKYSDWYVALKRTGQYKPGPKTGPGQKAILFLPMSAKS
ncbi:fibroblast growth factor 2 [Vidua chalybeata]|uniref:fibroblast growth factor 2 n=1 Tax=Vidua chalybeata TaxID=81927 RepID=UPI0023A7BF8B|nr:fibroblast growth factor 2 [Vidua chalybeata]